MILKSGGTVVVCNTPFHQVPDKIVGHASSTELSCRLPHSSTANVAVGMVKGMYSMYRMTPSSSGGTNSEPSCRKTGTANTTGAAAPEITAHFRRSVQRTTGSYMRIIQRLIAWSSSRRIFPTSSAFATRESHVGRKSNRSTRASRRRSAGSSVIATCRDRWRCQSCGTMSNLEVHHLQFCSHAGGRFRTKLDYALLYLSHSNPLRAVSERRAVRYIGFKLEEQRKVDEPHIRLAGMESASAKPPIPRRKVGLRSSSTTSPISIFRFRLCPRQRFDDVQNNFSIYRSVVAKVSNDAIVHAD